MFTETVEESLLSEIDMFETTPIALLYQTGYPTIKGYEAPRRYRLGIPNLEVREGLFKNLARHYFKAAPTAISNNVYEVRKLLEERKVDEALEQIKEKDFARQFTADPRPILYLGITFSTRTRNITAWKTEY